MDAYEQTAFAYDIVHASRGRDDEAQSARVAEIVRARRPSAKTLLDVACGTGAHLQHFQREFAVAGVDLSEAMLRRARERLPDVELHQGDMRSFTLDRTFDAVTCLFSSIGYLLTLDDVALAVANMRGHLVDGGVLIVEPWIHPAEWRDGHRVAEAGNAEGVAVARVSVSGRRGTTSWFDLYWTTATDDGVDSVIEHHELGLYTVEEYTDALTSAGFAVEHDPVGLIGRGLFIASAC